MRLNKNTMTITIPNLKAEDKITITLRTANSNEERGVNVSNASPAQCLGIGSSSEPYSATFTVSADGDVTLTPTGGIYIHTISVEGKNSVSTAISPKAVDREEQPAYNLYGQRVEPTSKGLVIWKGKKIYNK